MTGKTMTFDEIRQAAEVTRGDDQVTEMVTVRALVGDANLPFRDNGHPYVAGDVLHMEISMAAAAIGAGQVEPLRPEATTAQAQSAD